jgi:hypothetical protein
MSIGLGGLGTMWPLGRWPWSRTDVDVNKRLLDRLGWKWRHESPSPEPADPNDMDFSSSEVDALESIPPPAPPSPLPPFLFGHPPTEEGKRIFGAFLYEPEEPGSPLLAPPGGEQENDWTEAPAEGQITRSSARSTRHRGASSVPGQANRCGRAFNSTEDSAG